MNRVGKPFSWLLVWSLTAGLAGVAAAQDSTPVAPSPAAVAPPASGPGKATTKSSAQIDAGEPRVNTSPGSASDSLAGASAAGMPGVVTPGLANPTAGAPAAPTAARASRAGASSGTSPAGPKAPRAVDRLELGTATVTGDREQPKVMYIVPWKKADIGDISGKPMNSLLDEALAPVDRDEFKREVAYYGALQRGTPQNGAANAAAAQGEK